MRKSLTELYLTGWVSLLLVYGLVTYNRETDDSLGLYGLVSGPSADVWDAVTLASFLLIFPLSVVLLFRLKSWSWARLPEAALALSTWCLFLYNLSFYRS